MNYYKRHIGDYMKDASHLSLLEHGVFMRLLDVYYTREAAVPVDQAARLVGARSKEEREALQVVCGEFFSVVDGCYVQSRCDREIAAMQAKQETNRVIGQRGGRPKKEPKGLMDGAKTETQTVSKNNPDGFQTETQTVSRNNPDVTQATSHKPIAINQGAFVEHQQGGPGGPTRADFENRNTGQPGPDNREAPAVADAMRLAGIADASPGHPKLRALLADGLTQAELVSAAVYAAAHGRGFAYAMARAEGQRRDAASQAALPDAPPLPGKDPDSRAMIEADGLRLQVGAWRQVDSAGNTVTWPAYAAMVQAARKAERLAALERGVAA